jgi:membrane protein implicated in regulation of membrane protease activity
MTGIDPGWLWLIGGVLLLILEVIAPGFFLVFLGAAGLAPQLALFAIYAVIAVMAGRRFYSVKDASSDPLLNDRAGRLVGKVVTVVAPVDDHGGRVRVGDSEWSARGGPAAAGERVRITGVDGNCLKVETERALSPPA